jgi:hypothetical protein
VDTSFCPIGFRIRGPMCAHLLCLHTQFNVLCQVYRERSQNVEAELASMQAQLSDARRQIQSLTVILTQSAHTIQTALQGSSSEAEHLEKRQGLLSTLLHLLTSSPLTRSTPSHLTPYTPGDLGIVPPPGKRNYQIHQNSLQTGKGAL